MPRKCSDYPSYNLYQYSFDPELNKYSLVSRGLSGNYLPDLLKLERTFSAKIKADFILRGESEGLKLFTGLKPIDRNTFTGDHVSETVSGRRVKSLLIFIFSDNKDKLDIFYFRNFKKFGTPLISFTTNFIKHIQQNQPNN